MSNDTNLVIITARLTRDPDGRMAGNSNLAEIGVVVNESWYDKQAQEKKERAHFVDVTFWGQPADFACEYLKKGDKVLIEGSLDMQTWDDRDTGKKRSKLKLKGRRIQSLMTKDVARQQQPQQRAPQAPPPPPPFPEQQAEYPQLPPQPNIHNEPPQQIPDLEAGNGSLPDVPF